MKKNYFTFFLVLIAYTGLSAQVWEPVGTASGISAGGAGRLNLLNDFEDHLLVSYYDVSVTNVSVQKFDGTAWTYLGDGPGITAGTGIYNSFAIDNQGTAYLTNQLAWPEAGMQARKFENGAWVQLPDVTELNVNWQASAVSPDNVLFVASNDNLGTVRRLADSGEYWDEVGDTGFFLATPGFLDMAIGTNDMVYVSFNNNGYVHVYQNNVDATALTSSWSAVADEDNLAPAANSESYNSSLAIDSNNNLYLAYVSNSAGGYKLNVKKFDGVSWTQLGSENFTANRVQHTSIAVSSDGNVYVAVSNWENENFLKNYVLTYNEEDNAWTQVGTGFASEGQATNNSLTIDSSGNLFLGFVDSSLGKVIVKKLNLGVVAAESVAITTSNNLPAEITTDNGTLQLLASVAPSEASQNVVWSIVSGLTLATVDQNGLVTAIANNGTVTIQATSQENSSIYSTIEISITNQNSTILADQVIVTVEDNVYPDILSIGANLQLLFQVTPAEANQQVVWTVQGEGGNVVSIDQDGLLTALAEGTAVVRATHIDGEIYAEITVYVWDNGCTQGVPDDELFLDWGYNITDQSGYQGASDFIVQEGTTFEVDQIRMQVSINGTSGTLIDAFNLAFLTGDNGVPSVEFLVVENVETISHTLVSSEPDFDLYVYDVVIKLPELVMLNEGTYWLVPRAVLEGDAQAYWQVIVNGELGSDYYMTNSSNPLNSWFAAGDGGFEAVFEITGYCTETVLGVPDNLKKTDFSCYPNPVKDKLNFTTESDIKNISIYNLLGQNILSKNSNIANTLDTSGLPTGTYFVKAELENGQIETRKIIKE